MKQLIFIMMLAVAVVLAGIWYTRQPDNMLGRQQTQSLEEIGATEFQGIPERPSIPQAAPPRPIENALRNNDYESAVSEYENTWSGENADAAEQERQQLLARARTLSSSGRLGDAESLLLTYRESFLSDPDPLIMLSEIMERQGRIQEALNYSLEFRELLLDLDKQAIADRRIIALASEFKTEMEKIGNSAEILSLYQNLYNQYPLNLSIVYELANAYFEVEQYDQAWGLFNQLVYEPAYEARANRMLEKIREVLAETETTPIQKPVGNAVELARSGEHYLVDTRINAASATLLLDTGASITALDESLLRTIGAIDTGRRIQLQTANGLAEGKIYELRSLRIGRTRVHNFEVAGLDFGHQPRFDGLLGMDFLNMFSYTIDNSNHTLLLSPN